MPNIFKTVDFAGIGDAASTLFGALAQGDAAKGYKSQAAGYQAQAAGYRKAGDISGMNQDIASQASRITAVQADRELYQTLGGQRSDIAGANLAASGSALDVIRSSAAQGNLTKQLLGRQDAITQLGYEQEQSSYAAMAASADASASAANASASAAKKQKSGGILGSILKVAGVVAPLVLSSDQDLKQDVTLVRRRADGVGIYTFRYKGQPTLFEGVVAQDVQRVYPEAVSKVDGSYVVDYELIGVTPRVVEAA